MIFVSGPVSSHIGYILTTSLDSPRACPCPQMVHTVSITHATIMVGNCDEIVFVHVWSRLILWFDDKLGKIQIPVGEKTINPGVLHLYHPISPTAFLSKGSDRIGNCTRVSSFSRENLENEKRFRWIMRTSGNIQRSSFLVASWCCLQEEQYLQIEAKSGMDTLSTHLMSRVFFMHTIWSIETRAHSFPLPPRQLHMQPCMASCHFVKEL